MKLYAICFNAADAGAGFEGWEPATPKSRDGLGEVPEQPFHWDRTEAEQALAAFLRDLPDHAIVEREPNMWSVQEYDVPDLPGEGAAAILIKNARAQGKISDDGVAAIIDVRESPGDMPITIQLFPKRD